VDVQQVGTAADVADRLLVSLRAGGEGAPDIVDIEQTWFGQFLLGEETGLIDLGERLPEGALDDFAEARLALYSEPGHTYCLEHALVPVGLYYRVDLWEEAGVDPEEFETWDDFIEGAQQLPDDVAGIAFFRDHHQTLLRQRGQDYFTEDLQPAIDTELSVETLEWMIELQELGVAAPTPDINNIFAPEWWAAMQADEFASVIGADWFAGVMADNMPDLAGQWRVRALPVWEPGGVRTSVWGGTGACIVQYSDHIEQALDFLEFAFLSVEGNVQRYQMVGLFPPYLPALEDERLLEPVDYFGDQVVGELWSELGAEVPPQFQSPWRSDMIDALIGVADPLYRGELDVAETLSEINESILQQVEGAE
jgi:arabinosaccharide transport system substrate-binding protein